MSSVCREALKIDGEPTWAGDISLLAHSLIKITTGRGCTKLWQGLVKGTFANEATFEWMMRELRQGFKDHSEGLKQKLGDLLHTHP